MGLLSLIAKLTLDTKEFEAGVTRANSLSTRFANNLDKDVNKKINRAFGLGGLIALGGVVKRFTFDAAEELSTLASAQDLTVAQFVQIREEAERAGMSVEEFRRNVEKTGKTLKEVAEEKQLSLGAQLQEESTATLNRARRGAGGFARAIGFGLSETLANAIDFWRDLFGGDTETRSRGALPQAQRLSAQMMSRTSGPDPRFMSPRPDLIERDAFEIERKLVKPNVNALQQIGAATVREESVVELRTAVKVLRQIDGTLKKINQDQKDNDLELAP